MLNPPAPTNRQGWVVAFVPLLLFMGLLLWEVPAVHIKPLHKAHTAAARQEDKTAQHAGGTEGERDADPRLKQAASVAVLLQLVGEERLQSMARSLRASPPLAVPPQGPTPLAPPLPRLSPLPPVKYSAAQEPLGIDGEGSTVLGSGVSLPVWCPFSVSMWVMPWWTHPPHPQLDTEDTEDSDSYWDYQEEDDETWEEFVARQEAEAAQGTQQQEQAPSPPSPPLAPPLPLLQTFRDADFTQGEGGGMGQAQHLPSIFLLPPTSPQQGPKVLFSCVSLGGGMVKGVSSLTALTEGHWHHLAMTWDGHTLRAFLDGVMQGDLSVGYGGVLGSKSVSGLVAVLGKDPRLDIAATPGSGVGVDGLRVRLPSGRAGPGKAVLQHVALLTGTALTQEEVVRVGVEARPWPLPHWVTHTWTHTQHNHGGEVSNALLPRCLSHLGSLPSPSASLLVNAKEGHWCLVAACLWAHSETPTSILLHKAQHAQTQQQAPVLGSSAYEVLGGGVGVLPRLVLAHYLAHSTHPHPHTFLHELTRHTTTPAQQQALFTALLSPPSPLPPLPSSNGEGSCEGVLSLLVPLARWASARYGDVLPTAPHTTTTHTTTDTHTEADTGAEAEADATPVSSFSGVVVRPLQAADLSPPPPAPTGLSGVLATVLGGGGGERGEVGWERMRARHGDTQAMVRLGRGLYWGTGGPLERREAQLLFNQAAAAGDVEGLLNGGLLLAQSTDPLERDRGRQWVQEAAHKGSVGAYAVLGSWAIAAGDTTTALTCLRESVRLESLSPWSASTGEAHYLLALLEGQEDEVTRREYLVQAASRGHIQARLCLGLSLWNPAALLATPSPPPSHNNDKTEGSRQWVVKAGPLIDAVDVVLPPLYPNKTKEDRACRCEAAVALLRPVAHMALAGLWSSEEGSSDDKALLLALQHATLGPSTPLPPNTHHTDEASISQGLSAVLDALLGDSKGPQGEGLGAIGGLEVVYGAMQGQARAQRELGMALLAREDKAQASAGLALLHAAGVGGGESRALFEVGEWCRGQERKDLSACLHYYRLSYTQAKEGPHSWPPLLRLASLALWHTITREVEGAYGVMMLVMVLVLLARRTARQHHRDSHNTHYHDD